MKKKRSYQMRKRAEAQDETRLRIVNATMALHEELGPRAATISAIAERAGVQRLTVYRHFADDTALFEACTSRWLSLNPPPDPQRWEAIDDPLARLRAALTAFYDYYSATERMWTVSFRDVDLVPALEAPMAHFAAFVTNTADALSDRFQLNKPLEERLRQTVRHVLAFPTWNSLRHQNIDNAHAIALVVAWLNGVLTSPPK